MIYEGAPSSHLGSIAQTLLERLKANYRCLYLNSPAMVAGMRSHLAAAGLDLQQQIGRGALVLSSDQGHLVKGKFDTERMIASLRDALQQALADGYEGLWAAGDMTWEFGSEDNLEKLLGYERRLEAFMHAHPALCGVCLYHRDTLPSHALQAARATHPALYLSATLSQLNPLYEGLGQHA
jgi:hypothetical protein